MRLTGSQPEDMAGAFIVPALVLVLLAAAFPVAVMFVAVPRAAARIALCDERGGFMSIDRSGHDVCLVGVDVLRFDGLVLKP